MKFYLGTHQPHWLKLIDTPLFVSARRLRMMKTLPKAKGMWALDSGGFSELLLYGKYNTDAMTYSTEVRRWKDSIGNMEFAAIQDWMCEPWMVEKTGLSVKEHQRRTIANYKLLKQLAPDMPWIPVLQGWKRDDYVYHLDQYGNEGIDLRKEKLVGLGSVCRRQSTYMVESLIVKLNNFGIKLHGFGFKIEGLKRVGKLLKSADSMAWSFAARRGKPLPSCSKNHKKCNNCIEYALWWNDKIKDIIS